MGACIEKSLVKIKDEDDIKREKGMVVKGKLMPLTTLFLALTSCDDSASRSSSEACNSYVCEEMHTLRYATVKYVADIDSPYVEISGGDSIYYRDYGSTTNSPRSLYVKFYISAYNNVGAITYVTKPGDPYGRIDKACFGSTTCFSK